MTHSQRTIRTTPRKGIRLDDSLVPLFVSEMIEPSHDLWLVSGWISDVAVLDNTDDNFTAVLGEGHAGPIPLTTVLSLITERGAVLHVSLRPNSHNNDFIGRLRRRVTAERLRLHVDDDIHEKTLCGSNWVVSGSMNFTRNGTEVNNEALTYTIDSQLAAQTRLDFEHRWQAPA
jgi:hypothetical protein